MTYIHLLVLRDCPIRRANDRSVATECARSSVMADTLSKYGDIARRGLVFGFAAASRAISRSGLQVVRRPIVAVNSQRDHLETTYF
jgi:hypothetical protein